MNAEDISVRICAISGKQISSGSSKIETEPLPSGSKSVCSRWNNCCFFRIFNQSVVSCRFSVERKHKIVSPIIEDSFLYQLDERASAA